MFKKALIAGLTTTAIVGIGIFLYLRKNSVQEHSINKLFNKFSNKNKLNKDAKYLEDWALRWGKYIDANTKNGKLNDKDIWELDDWATSKSNRFEVPKSFADECEKQLEFKVKNKKDPRFLNYLNWCTI